jgi:hypothetical protein
MSTETFPDLNSLASDLRAKLEAPNAKKFILLYAYNGTGKTRLSAAFKDIGKQTGVADTLYFNAFTEDLFTWHNDLESDNERYLVLHPASNFLLGLEGFDMDTKVYEYVKRYADFQFDFGEAPLTDVNGRFLRNQKVVRFYRSVQTSTGSKRVDNIKISRGEENLFIWCFYLAVLQMVLDGDKSYERVKYIYIDDPISSLDENHAIAVATQLTYMLVNAEKKVGTVISTHHVLFFNVLCNGFGKKKAERFLLKNDDLSEGLTRSETSEKPFLHHLAALAELDEAQKAGAIKRHHFNIMRCIMEQTAIFCGLEKWQDCLPAAKDDLDRAVYERMINVMSHADYLISEPEELPGSNVKDFQNIFKKFIDSHSFKLASVPSTTP